MAIANFENRTLYHGDNLDFLRGMNSETVHLVATDPPFNKNRDFHATPDSLARGARFSDRWSWERDVHEEWTDSIRDDWPGVWHVITSTRGAYGDDMAAFLCWLGVRLMEMRRVLREDGSLYLHCDPTASHYIKALLDGIFGPESFRSEITWKRTSAHSDGRQGRRQHGRIHDILFFYTKSDQWTWNQIYTDYDPQYIERSYRYVEPGTNRRYRLDNLTGPGGAAKGNPQYEVMGVTRYWRYSKERMKELIDAGRIVQRRPGAVPSYKRYLDEMPGVPLQDQWTDIGPIQSRSKERTGYPTQKPIALYERIVEASSNPGDIVLDPFAGCATTPIAAERLGRQWVGMDIWDEAYRTVLTRLGEESLAVREADSQQPHLITFGDVHYVTAPPERTDDNEVAAPSFRLRTKLYRPVEPWQKLSRAVMSRILAHAQNSGGLVVCGGCGRILEAEFMHLDHIQPRAEGGENHIMNRILLCSPCNGRKGHIYTLAGLLRENKRVGWMKDESMAKLIQSSAKSRAEWIRDMWDTGECEEFLAGLG